MPSLYTFIYRLCTENTEQALLLVVEIKIVELIEQLNGTAELALRYFFTGRLRLANHIVGEPQRIRV